MKRLLFAVMLALLLAPCALGEYDADTAADWLERFSQAISGFSPQNDARLTADPARPGEYLLEYDFGVVAARTHSAPAAGDILRVEIATNGVMDCRGGVVGQTLEDVIGGRQIGESSTPLYVLTTQESGYGWSWAYVSGGEVYGVEYITYGGDALAMKEYTLTYVIEDDVITAIRMQVCDATLAQAEDGLRTAEEIAGRQRGEVLVTENEQRAFEQEDMTVSYRRAIGVPVETLIAAIGEPREVQSLPNGTGRMLVYDFAVVELIFEEMTGVEYVRAISCASDILKGPRSVAVGMSLQEAAALFRCDGDVMTTGGVLYLAGEAQGIAPYGEMILGGAGEYTLRYACEMDGGAVGVLDVVTAQGVVTHWHLYLETAEAAYGG